MENVYTLEQRWEDAFKSSRYYVWDVDALEYEKEACLDFIDIYIKSGHDLEVKRLSLKVKHLQKIIDMKNSTN